MSIHKKITLATFIALGLAACGGGGSGSPSTAATSNGDIKAAKAALAAEAAEPSKTVAKVDAYTITVGGKEYKVAEMQKGAVVDLSNGSENVRAYRQAYSVVAGKFDVKTIKGATGENSVETMKELMSVGLVNGEATQVLPTAGKYDYNGAAFSNSETGRLAYTVDFDKRIGSGSITGLRGADKIALENAGFSHTAFNNSLDGSQVRAHGIQGKITEGGQAMGDYSMHFFGKNAEEIAGVVYHNQKGEIGVAGKR